jgi:predicted dehydrogenase
MKNTDERIRIAVAGCGAHSHIHAGAVKADTRLALAACCDIDDDRARSWALEYGCSPYHEMTRMLSGESVDAVIICTWPSQHCEQIRACLDAGIKNILCEKSLTMSGSDALEIYSLVKSHGAFLMEGCMYRHHPAIRKVEQLVSGPDAGKIDCIRAAFSNYEPIAHTDSLATGDWRYRRECGGGVTHDWMSYCVNAANHFSGSLPKRVFASGNVNEQYGVIDRIYGHIEYENGIVGIVESSKHANFTQMLHISCANGIIQLPVAWGIYGDVTINRHHRKEKWDYILTDQFRIEEADSFALQLDNFVNVIRGTAEPLVPLYDSVVNVITIDALERSVHEGKVIEPDFPAITLLSTR